MSGHTNDIVPPVHVQAVQNRYPATRQTFANAKLRHVYTADDCGLMTRTLKNIICKIDAIPYTIYDILYSEIVVTVYVAI